LILVDTKYEFGFDENGAIVLADEVHTPDSSRYWLLASYKSSPSKILSDGTDWRHWNELKRELKG
jgi:phosphoribosylaminoimidazole-succinocarboxamide synthase